MKNTLIIISALIALHSAAAQYAVTNAWDVDVLDPVAYVTDVWRGETIPLTARTGVSNIADSATFLWQTGGMGSAWWQTNATITASGEITTVWIPTMDSGASAYSFFFRVGSDLYRPFGTIKMRGSPGATPNSLPLPTLAIDFDVITVLNPPWATPADVSAAIGEAAEQDPIATPIAQQALDKAYSITLAGLGGLTNTAPIINKSMSIHGGSAKITMFDPESSFGNFLELSLNGFFHGTISNSKFIWYPPNNGTMATQEYADSKVSNAVSSHNTSPSAHSNLFAPLATTNWVNSLRGIHADIASNIVYHIVVSNGHWLIKEVQ